jgi:DnaJ homolog subfamily C member 13
MKAIIEEGSPDIAAHMQDLALSEGALPVHLMRALFTAPNDTRLLPLKYLSQQLLALWSTGHPTTYGLLKRVFPLGLTAYLDSSEEPEKDFGKKCRAASTHQIFSNGMFVFRRSGSSWPR